jgi:hypothetical protein
MNVSSWTRLNIIFLYLANRMYSIGHNHLYCFSYSMHIFVYGSKTRCCSTCCTIKCIFDINVKGFFKLYLSILYIILFDFVQYSIVSALKRSLIFLLAFYSKIKIERFILYWTHSLSVQTENNKHDS